MTENCEEGQVGNQMSAFSDIVQQGVKKERKDLKKSQWQRVLGSHIYLNNLSTTSVTES